MKGEAEKGEQVPSSVQPAEAMKKKKKDVILIIKNQAKEDQVLIELKQWSNLLLCAMVITQARKKMLQNRFA